jgi:hypothetical protein
MLTLMMWFLAYMTDIGVVSFGYRPPRSDGRGHREHPGDVLGDASRCGSIGQGRAEPAEALVVVARGQPRVDHRLEEPRRAGRTALS